MSRDSGLTRLEAVLAVLFIIALIAAGVGWTRPAPAAETVTQTVKETVTVAGETVTVTAAERTVTQTVTAPGTTVTETVTVGAAQKPKITILTSAPLSRYVRFYEKDAERVLGIDVEVVEVPYGEMFEKISTDIITGANRFDLFLGPGDFIGTLASQGWIMNLDEFMTTYPFLEDYLPWIREKVMKWAGSYYALDFDGDAHTIFYRKDIWTNPEYRQKFKEEYGYEMPSPPKTIDELIDVACFFNGWDWDGDGEINYGIGLSAKRGAQSAWTIIDFAAQYAVKPGPPSKYTGVLYFDPETMEPLVNTPGWIEGFKKFKEILECGPPGITDFDVSDVRARFMAGELAIGLDWTDSGPLSIAPDSKVKGKVAWAKIPGAPKYWDREKGEWVEEYNQIGILNFGGWVWYVMKSVEEKPYKDLVFIFLIFMTTPDKAAEMAVAHGETGVNIFRFSHLYEKVPDYWIEQGWDPESAANYSAVINELYNSPYVLTDIRIPGFERYWDALDLATANVATGVWTPEQAAEELYKAWKQITEELGVEEQLKWYRQDLGLPT